MDIGAAYMKEILLMAGYRSRGSWGTWSFHPTMEVLEGGGVPLGGCSPTYWSFLYCIKQCFRGPPRLQEDRQALLIFGRD